MLCSGSYGLELLNQPLIRFLSVKKKVMLAYAAESATVRFNVLNAQMKEH